MVINIGALKSGQNELVESDIKAVVDASEDVELMREVVGPNMGVKAAGGTRSYKDAQAFIKAGANRIGTSAGVAIMEGESVDGGY